MTVMSFLRYSETLKKGEKEHAPELSSSFVEKVEYILFWEYSPDKTSYQEPLYLKLNF